MPHTFTARAVLLDMDGTLVDSTAVVERLWLEWAADHGLDDDRVLSVIHGRQGHESMAILLPDRDPAINRAENAQMLSAEGVDTDGVVAVPGASALLEALRGTPHALVTSADERLATARMDAAALRVPDVRVTAEHVTRSKPDPEGFLRGAQLLGVAPRDCLAFEDSQAGIAAALAAGTTVIGVGERAAGHGAAAVVGDLSGVSARAVDGGIEVSVG
ncbi:HAD-IA family hydrolase [Microbacterium horticulturae]|uniref:HAD-IA family hydrolase n=1 Tax=Microbacterium horticulturae TaxID=3028316 RepID=A0ABY8BV08_9MICO|nr:HAD-IA family hydrolase [Microbacterium sp. KACC 23027]WEG08004.1 HAD-IA family hydrolase [Microbacterium sp. KACC 23027]